MSIAVTPTVVQDIVDNADERELWIVGREFERPPYFHAGKGGDTRLARALRVCIDNRIMPNGDGTYMVEGSEHRTYRVGDSCSCPNSQKAHTKWCYHMVAVALYVEWQRRLRPGTGQGVRNQGVREDGDTPAPAPSLPSASSVELGTLRAGTLPLPPTTVDERLSAAAHGAVQAAIDLDTVPQEDRMPDDAYIPEPEEAFSAPDSAFPAMGSTAVLDEPVPRTPDPVKIPREFTVNIKGRTHVLYTGLVLAARQDGLTSLSADWTYNDAELSLAHAVCTFADGRRYEESGDASPSNVSKGISLHFRRVALTRAKARCLRDALGISECSVEEMEDDGGKRDTPVMTPPTGQEYRQRIWHMVKGQAPDMRTREQVETWIKAETGYTLHPDNYRDIIGSLETRA